MLQISAGCPHVQDEVSLLFGAADYITGDAFGIERCGACGLVQTAPQPEDLDRYYPDGYYGQGPRYSATIEHLLRRLYDARAASIERAAGGNVGRVLDIGCGRGLLLEALRRRGWQASGTELSEGSAAYARDTLGLDVRTAEVDGAGFAPETFDAVIIWHVLEHMRDPQRVLAAAARVLRPGGLLLVAVPNFGSLEARATGPAWFQLDVPRHLHHFTAEGLRRLLLEVGLDPRQPSYWAPEYDAFSLAQSLLNRMGIRHNLLYELLRTRGAKVLDGHSRPIPHADVLATLALGPLFVAGAAILTPLLAGLRQGGTVTFRATKARGRR